MKKKYIFTVIVLLGFLQSCDKVEEPYIKDGAYIWNGRKSIVFDFTGHKCGNCPRAHETITGLVEKYSDAIIPIAIHSTWYATVQDDTSQAYHYDFRTDVGDYLGGRDFSTGYYGELYLPMGMVNSYSGDSLTTHNLWGSKLTNYLSLYPEFLVSIEGDYTSTDSMINCNVDVETYIANNRNLSLTVFILEDHILQWQKDYEADPEDIEGYEHNHVLRAGMNGAFGESIKDNTNTTSVGDIFTKSYSIKQGKDWVINNCLIVAFVYDTETEEILQAEVLHLNE